MQLIKWLMQLFTLVFDVQCNYSSERLMFNAIVQMDITCLLQSLRLAFDTQCNYSNRCLLSNTIIQIDI